MPGNQTKIHGTSIKLSSTIPARNGYTFQGWSANSAQTGTGEYQAGATYTRDANITLYAVWKEKPIEIATSYVGYYADVNGDKKPDGIIYADLGVGGSGTWNNDGWSNYKYSKVTGLKSYYVSSESYTGFNGKWTQPVITTVQGSTGANRFYVMALEDINPGSTYYWYYNSKGKLDNTVSNTTNDFGQGKTYTKTMISKWNNSAYGSKNNNDMWGVIQSKVGDINNPTWFIPSKTEWAAFGDMIYSKLKVTASNYTQYNFKDYYWTSTQLYEGHTYRACFKNGGEIGYTYVYRDHAVRLSTMF